MAASQCSVVRLAGGRRLGLRRWPGEGDPLVLLHGLLDSADGWSDLARHTRRPFLAFDLAGSGRSDHPERPEISADAGDVVEALESLHVERCTLVGHSFGGAVAAAVAERSPAVRALVLLAPAGFGRIPLAEALSRRLVADLTTLALPLALVNPLAVAVGYSAFVSHRRLPDRALVTRLRSQAARTAVAARAATAAIAAAGRAAERRPHRRLRFAGPVAALWGEHDALVPPAHARGLRAAAPQATVQVWPGMGHHPQRERPRQLAHFVEWHAAAAERRSSPGPTLAA